MALASSGTISIGGSTANRSINLELGRSATATTSLGESTLRGLAGVSSGAISMSNFHGKSSTFSPTLTVGSTSWESCIKNCVTTYAYGYSATYGSLSYTTVGTISGSPTVTALYWDTSDALYLAMNGITSNSGWSTLTIGSTSFSRTSGYHWTYGTGSTWSWYVSTNPIGTSGTKTVTIT